MWFPVFISNDVRTVALSTAQSSDHNYFVKYFNPYHAFLQAGQQWGKLLLKTVQWLPRNTIGDADNEYTWPHWNELSAIFELWQLRGHRLEIEFTLPTSQDGNPKVIVYPYDFTHPAYNAALLPLAPLDCQQQLSDMYIWSDQGRTEAQVYTNRVNSLIAMERRKHKYVRKPRRYFKFRTKFSRRVRKRWVDINSSAGATYDKDAHQFLTESPFKVATQDAFYDQPLYQPRAQYVNWANCEVRTPVTLNDQTAAPVILDGSTDRLLPVDLYAAYDNRYEYRTPIDTPVAHSPNQPNARVRLTAYFRCKKFY